MIGDHNYLGLFVSCNEVGFGDGDYDMLGLELLESGLRPWLWWFHLGWAIKQVTFPCIVATKSSGSPCFIHPSVQMSLEITNLKTYCLDFSCMPMLLRHQTSSDMLLPICGSGESISTGAEVRRRVGNWALRSGRFWQRKCFANR